MSAMQETLFPVVEVGSHVKVFHKSGDLEGCGEVVAYFKTQRTPGWIVRLYDGPTVLRPEIRVVLNVDVLVV